LFGDGGSESEESVEDGKPPTKTEPEKNSPQVETKKPRPDKEKKSQTKKTQPQEEIEPEEEPLLQTGSDQTEFSTVPTFTSSLGMDDPIAEEQEIRLEQMPYNLPVEGAQLNFFKLASLTIEPRPFDESTFTVGDEEGDDARKTKKKTAPTTVRWRYSLDQNRQDVIKTSNARFVKWSDGSMHLFVGKEAFGVQQQEYKDHHHLFIRQRKDMHSESYLQCHGILEKKLIVNPIDNIAQIKKETLMKLKTLKSQETNRERRQFIASTSDPEKEKKQKEQMESNRSELRRKFGRDQVQPQELSMEFLEQGAGAEYDEEKEKASEARIMAAKRGRNSSDEEDEYEDEEQNSDQESDKKRQKR